jgi:hypothetical protein
MAPFLTVRVLLADGLTADETPAAARMAADLMVREMIAALAPRRLPHRREAACARCAHDW